MERAQEIKERYDAVIVGGGLVGLSLAAALGGAGMTCLVIDAEDPAVSAAEPFDGRSFALARGTCQLLSAIGIWPLIEEQAQPILDIRVSDGKIDHPASPFFLHYSESDLGEGPMGQLVESRVLRRALYRHLATVQSVTLLAPMKVEAVSGAGGLASVQLGDGRLIKTPLAIAADGKNSPLRRAAGIKTRRWDYAQTGVVATVALERPHQGTAFEHFLPSGPFAVLPLVDGEDGKGRQGLHRASLVWTEKPALAKHLIGLNDETFSHEIARRFGDSLGKLSPIGGRWLYPLSLQWAETIFAPRLALVGDAAHVIHPIAGQGLNLALRDVAALAEVVVDAWRLGLDHGTNLVLSRYQAWRRFDSILMAAVTDGLNRLFSNDLGPLRLARDLGMAAVNRVKPVKRFFMRHAMGLVGDLPRLIRGETL